MDQPKLRIISLGAGVQSTTVALMAARGVIGPMPDCAIFADTGWEPRKVYEHLQWLQSVLPFPVHIVQVGNIRDHLVRAATGQGGRFAAIPFFSLTDDGKKGMGRRQCTREFKLEPIARKQRELLGLRPRQWGPKNAVETWIGISTDEAIRMKPSPNRWAYNRWPLIEQEMSRQDCLDWCRDNGFPVPPKSSCIGCPFHSDAHWLDMKLNAPDEWADAVAMDHLMRANGTMKGMTGRQFMHAARIPLDQVDLSKASNRSYFGNECEGMCGN